MCKLDHWSEVIGINQQARDALMAFDPQDFIARMDALAAELSRPAPTIR